ncbi:MAG: Eco57I restriction-modification methylase domain-containing protein [Candidatus Hodarchaeota archaeon]
MQPLSQKALGIYYTPSQISQYIAREAVCYYLLNQLKKTTFEKTSNFFLSLKSYLTYAPADVLAHLYSDFLPYLSILDNSCGSGAFLIEALKVLLEIYLFGINRFKASQSLSEKGLIELNHLNNLEAQIYHLKRQILANNIYGVDIDKKAVEKCKKRLQEILIESCPSQASFTALPAIDYTILTGNSLLGIIDIPKSLQSSLRNSIKSILQKRSQFISQLQPTIKQNQIKALRSSINEITDVLSNHLDEVLLQLLEAQNININDFEDLFVKSPFHWRVEYSQIFQQGGFDIIIGNPPWIQSKFMNKVEKQYYRTFFLSTSKQFDIFNAFVERSYNLLKPGGILAYILPTRFVMNPDYEVFRKYLLDHFKIIEIVDIGENVFENVNMPSLILLASKEFNPNEREKSQIIFKMRKDKLKDSKQEYTIPQKRFIQEPRKLFTIYQSEKVANLCQVIRQHSDPFRTFVTNNRGVEIGKKHPIISLTFRDERDVPFLIGEDIKRYQICNRHWIRLGVPNINYKNHQLYQGSKILIRKTGKGINATIDEEKHYVIGVIYVFKPKLDAPNSRYLLALLNSKLMVWYYFMVFGEQYKKSFPHLRQQCVLDLPIKRIKSERDKCYETILAQLATCLLLLSGDSEKIKVIREFVDHMLIDNLVYELYLYSFTNSDLIGVLGQSWKFQKERFPALSLLQWVKDLQNNASVHQEAEKIQTCLQIQLIEQKLEN